MEIYSQVEHDKAVRRYALILTTTGHHVKARVEGWFEAPTYINGYRPDIIVQEENQWIIIEVKKGDIDWPKISAFKQYVDSHDNYSIKVISPEEVWNTHGKLDLHVDR